MRSWFSTAVLAWVTAVLVTSPVLAGRSCLDCCAARKVHVAEPPCCSQHAASLSGAADSCRTCPKCEITRPIPVTPVSVVPGWQPSDVAIDTVPLTDLAMAWELSSADWEDALAVRATSPPLQILYCSWLI